MATPKMKLGTSFAEKLRDLDMAARRMTWAIQRPDPYRITGPAVISFSGGRTSAYMLWRILQAHGGVLPPDVYVLFENTGREMPATLDFVNECAKRWYVPVIWLEYDGTGDKPSYKVVTYETADRTGKPFEEMLKRKSALPNPVSRFCTIELKIRTAKRYVVAEKGWKRWTSVVGLRADEPGRMFKATDIRRNKKDRWDVICPLYEDGVEEIDVLDFWKAQPFRLNLRGRHEGNCDGCFLKSRGSLARMLRDYPDQMTWWPRQEAVPRGDGAGATFHPLHKRPTYAQMTAHVAAGGTYKNEPEDDLPCDDLGCGI